MLYSSDKNFLFVHVARTAGVSIERMLRAADPNARSLVGQHAPLVAAKAELGERYGSSYKFAFVRNPWDRLASWNAHLARVQLADAEPGELADPEQEHWRRFDELIEAVVSETIIIDGVPRCGFSQFHQLSDANGALLPDRIGRFESLHDDLAKMCDEANVRVPPLTHLNASVPLDAKLYYSSWSREFVADRLAEDSSAFGYEFPT